MLTTLHAVLEVLVLVAVATRSSGKNGVECPGGWRPYRNLCYLRVDIEKTFDDAQAFCQSQGGNLASIPSKQANEFVKTHMDTPQGQGSYWIGLKVYNWTALPWNWNDGELVSQKQANWDDGSPDANGGKCTEYKMPKGVWDDKFCNEVAKFFCSKTKDECKERWVPHEKRCYKKFELWKSYDIAQENCKKEYANLAAIPTKKANEFIRNSLGLRNNGRYWIGLRESDWKKLPWHWKDGEVVDQNETNWATDEPNNNGGVEQCAEILSPTGLWNDIPCSIEKHYLCSQIKNGCPSGWSPYENRCFKAFEGSKSFDESQFSCEKTGGNLATIASKAVNEFIPRIGLSKSEYWIGLKKSDKDGTPWIWKDGEELDKNQASWSEGESGSTSDSNNADDSEDCVLYSTSTKTWNENNCAERKSYICSQDRDECHGETDNCPSSATCINQDLKFTCKCQEGFEFDGESCNDVDECNAGDHNCHDNADCENTEGSFSCTCQSGYRGNGISCTDINECNDKTHSCEEKSRCINTEGNYTCLCNDGFTGDGRKICKDLDECSSGDNNCHKSADCENVVGSFNCKCRMGYSGNGIDCSDINECDENTDSCADHATCTNTEGNYTCSCNEGFSGNGRTCIDINECSSGENNCHESADCVNTVGSFSCQCNSGYSGNGVICSDINECTDNKNDCSENAICINTQGNYTCSCKEGFTGDGSTCEDINECDENKHSCEENSKCQNTPGNYSCLCDEGFSGNGRTCEDIDECSSNENNCHENADCENIKGSFSCKCKIGFSGEGTSCADIDECKAKTHTCGKNSSCSNTKGNYTCSCNEGFTGDGRTCEDVDECSTGENNCHQDAICENIIGSFSCKCKRGFNGNGKNCTDINECNEKTHSCGENSMCNNSEGNYTCSCNQGFSGDGRVCEDVDECAADESKCHNNADCFNTNGSFTCTCKMGFSGNGINCTDIDECGTANRLCHENAYCENRIGNFSCKCNVGYTGNGVNCTDINECDENTHMCGTKSSCINTEGNYTCQCNNGFTGDGRNCTDIDECNPSKRKCDDNAYCENMIGSFTCQCKVGYNGNGISCTDINECNEKTHTCGENSMCSNTEGNYTCSCNEGFSGDGRICNDINECNENLKTCGENSKCINTDGNYTCLCKKGFTGDGRTCANVDECKINLDDCGENSNCKDSEGSYSCYCNTGFSGDGFNCLDIDECKENKNNCGENAQCANTVGSFTCSCKEGYKGNGTTCTVSDTFEVFCYATYMAVKVSQSYYTKQGISLEDLHLSDVSCSGVKSPSSPKHWTFNTTSLTSCSTAFRENKTHFIYSNTISNVGSSGVYHGSSLYSTFSCAYEKELGDVALLSFKYGVIQNVKNLTGPAGLGQFSAKLNLFTDDTYGSVENKTKYQATDTIFAMVKLNVNFSGLTLVIDRCWVTATPELNDESQYVFIEDGCPVSKNKRNVKIIASGVGKTARFESPVFAFINYDTTYLHCSLEICSTAGGTSCSPICNLERRSLTADMLRHKRQTRLSEQYSDPEIFSVGPLTVTRDQNDAADVSPANAMSTELPMAAFMTLLAAFVIVTAALLLFAGLWLKGKQDTATSRKMDIASIRNPTMTN